MSHGVPPKSAWLGLALKEGDGERSFRLKLVDIVRPNMREPLDGIGRSGAIDGVASPSPGPSPAAPPFVEVTTTGISAGRRPQPLNLLSFHLLAKCLRASRQEAAKGDEREVREPKLRCSLQPSRDRRQKGPSNPPRVVLRQDGVRPELGTGPGPSAAQDGHPVSRPPQRRVLAGM